MNNSITFKIATTDWEFEKINKLNYETFVEEIPQHETNEKKLLIDKFDDENKYFIAMKNKELLGMIAFRDNRPFSLDKKLDNIDSYLPSANRKCEVRLLSVKKEYRNGTILSGLLRELGIYILKNQYDLILISGILNQQKLYKHMGFIPFGPVVGTATASFQPMYMTIDNCNFKKLLEKKTINLLPGPVKISTKVKKVFSNPPISHRSTPFKKIFSDTKKKLCNLVNAKYVELFMGSGTLANDIILGQISLLKSNGLILSNGEFGTRLIDGGKRFNLNFKTYVEDFGKTFDLEILKDILNENKDIKWIFLTHCETSNGILNDINKISNICKKRNILLCLDAISSIGNVDLDLSDIYLTSCVSGKGLASFCGLSMVFYNHKISDLNNNLPRYLDLYKYTKNDGIPYTLSSNLLYALHQALIDFNKDEKFNNIKKLNNFFRNKLIETDIEILNENNFSSPAVITIPIDSSQSSKNIGDLLKSKGFLVSYESNYLIKQNLIQVCFMGDISINDLKLFIKTFKSIQEQINTPTNYKFEDID